LNADAFVTKLSATGDELVYSTYLGGSWDGDFGGEAGEDIAVDSAGCAYVTGHTRSNSFPTQDPYQGTYGSHGDAFVTKLSAAGDSLIYSTYLGGSDQDEGLGIAIYADGSACITGWTASDDFPTQSPYQGTNAGDHDAFVSRLSTEGNSLVYSTYLGGGSSDKGFGIAVDAAGDPYIAGETYSINFPTENPYQGTFAGGFDAFVAKFGRIPTASVESATGTGIVTFTIDSGSISDLTATLHPPCGFGPPGVSFPHGFFSFNIADIAPGSTVAVSITFPVVIVEDAEYWKCTPTGWVRIPVDSIAGNVMTIRLTDGGLGDGDGVVNGTIVDPGGLAVRGPLPPWLIILTLLILLIVTAIVILLRRFLRRPGTS
jgi:hypothetical protein